MTSQRWTADQSGHDQSTMDATSNVATIEALPGQSIAIPCNISKWWSQAVNQQQTNHMGVTIILWYKNNELSNTINSPIYTLDARQVPSLSKARHQIGSESFSVPTIELANERLAASDENRLHFDVNQQVPSLIIRSVEAADQGLYRCRVDFKKAPTQIHKVKLQLITPPSKLLVTDQLGHSVSGQIGPYDEGSSLRFTCESDLGKPETSVYWWRLSSINNNNNNNNHRHMFDAHQQQHLTNSKYRQWPKSGWKTLPDGQQTRQLSPAYVASHDHSIENNNSGSDNQYITTFGDQNRLIASSQATQMMMVKQWTKLVDHSQQTLVIGNRIQNILHINVSRNDQSAEFMCTSSNNLLSAPLNISISLNLNLRPTQVKIAALPKGGFFRADVRYEILCHAYGSRPSPKIAWLRNKEELVDETQSHKSHSSLDDKATSITETISRDNVTSHLTYVPTIRDNGQQFTCSARNLQMPNLGPMSDSIVMDVHYAAKLSLQFGANINGDSIKLGSDVFFDCNIVANPYVSDITWLFEDSPLLADSSQGIVISNQSLVIQNIRLHHRGHYQCLAYNTEGRSYSNKLFLNVKFAPICAPQMEHSRYEVGLRQMARVECHVLAEPADDLQFKWFFNQTAAQRLYEPEAGSNKMADTINGSNGLREIKQFETNFTTSVALFTPRDKSYYGQLLCLASNSLGEQEKFCSIDIVPAGYPDPVTGCHFDNHTSSSITVHCKPGSDNGYKQTYYLELYNNSTMQLVANVTEKNPNFHVDSLSADNTFILMIYSANVKGKSVAASYQTSTRSLAADSPKLTAQHRFGAAMSSTLASMKLSQLTNLDQSWLTLLLFASALVFVTLSVIVILTIRCRYKRKLLTTSQQQQQLARQQQAQRSQLACTYDKKQANFGQVMLSPANLKDTNANSALSGRVAACLMRTSHAQSASALVDSAGACSSTGTGSDTSASRDTQMLTTQTSDSNTNTNSQIVLITAAAKPGIIKHHQLTNGHSHSHNHNGSSSNNNNNSSNNNNNSSNNNNNSLTSQASSIVVPAMANGGSFLNNSPGQLTMKERQQQSPSVSMNDIDELDDLDEAEYGLVLLNTPNGQTIRNNNSDAMENSKQLNHSDHTNSINRCHCAGNRQQQSVYSSNTVGGRNPHLHCRNNRPPHDSGHYDTLLANQYHYHLHQIASSHHEQQQQQLWQARQAAADNRYAMTAARPKCASLAGDSASASVHKRSSLVNIGPKFVNEGASHLQQLYPIDLYRHQHQHQQATSNISDDIHLSTPTTFMIQNGANCNNGNLHHLNHRPSSQMSGSLSGGTQISTNTTNTTATDTTDINGPLANNGNNISSCAASNSDNVAGGGGQKLQQFSLHNRAACPALRSNGAQPSNVIPYSLSIPVSLSQYHHHHVHEPQSPVIADTPTSSMPSHYNHYQHDQFEPTPQQPQQE